MNTKLLRTSTSISFDAIDAFFTKNKLQVRLNLQSPAHWPGFVYLLLIFQRHEYPNAFSARILAPDWGSKLCCAKLRPGRGIDEIEELEPSVKDKLIFLANAIIRDAKTGKAYAH